jgi:hypothetical protein
MRVRESPQLAYKEGLDNKTGLDKTYKVLDRQQACRRNISSSFRKRRRQQFAVLFITANIPYVNFDQKRNHSVWFASCKRAYRRLMQTSAN